MPVRSVVDRNRKLCSWPLIKNLILEKYSNCPFSLKKQIIGFLNESFNLNNLIIHVYCLLSPLICIVCILLGHFLQRAPWEKKLFFRRFQILGNVLYVPLSTVHVSLCPDHKQPNFRVHDFRNSDHIINYVLISLILRKLKINLYLAQYYCLLLIYGNLGRWEQSFACKAY